MKEALLDLVICPSCLPEEKALKGSVMASDGDDILKGVLTCPRCKRRYPIEEGIAFLDPESHPDRPPAPTSRTPSKYETMPVLSSYLWSHFGDILSDPEASTAYREWAELMATSSGMAIDLGCAVGRFAFEMTQKADLVVGVDTSVSFIRSARRLMVDRRMRIDLKEEGLLTRTATVVLPEAWDSRKVEFIVADAQALPFPAGTFSSLASLNLVDKMPLPVRHLKEVYRLAPERGAQFLLSDPFSWSEEAAEQRDWLGGTKEGPFAGRGLENIAGLLSRDTDGWSPPWRVERKGSVWWKIRTHANHFELIRSCYVKAVRD